jgi:5-methylcytosine-specific restriction endonuclease McrA
LTARGPMLASPAMSTAALSAPPLQGRSLVLNRAFLPIHVTTVRRALSLLYRGVARAVDGEYRTFDFADWSELSTSGFDAVGLVEGVVRIPRVVLLTSFDRVPQRRVRFSRHNIFVRDANTCQYCARRFARSDLNLDHVIPRCRGGKTTWENVVCSCIECNRRKGGTDPAAAGMRLIRVPQRPAWSPFVAKQFGVSGYREWVPFLRAVDTAYWNVELDPD